MMIGNIPKHIRRERSKNTWICIGLLPTIPLDNVRPNLQWHAAVHHILQPLQNLEPYLFLYADGYTHKCFPILNRWVADHPEQCTVALVKQNHCPICEVPKNKLGEPQPAGGWKYCDP